eukprot:1664184-Pleurochrysis_carterae.AAC.1
MQWAGVAGGEVEVTVRRSPTSPPEPQPVSALLAGSVGTELGVLVQGGERGAAAASIRVGTLPAELR